MEYLQWLNNEVCQKKNNLTLQLHPDTVCTSLEELVKAFINLKLSQKLKQQKENIDSREEEMLEEQISADDPDYSLSSSDTGFFSVYSGFPPSSKTNISKFQFDLVQGSI